VLREKASPKPQSVLPPLPEDENRKDIKPKITIRDQGSRPSCNKEFAQIRRGIPETLNWHQGFPDFKDGV
jgi:hypothetical protein